MEKDIFNIIEEKEYNQLSAQELEMVAEFCANEDEYLQMQHVLVSVQEVSQTTETPHQATKDKLDDLFAAQSFPKAAPIWYNKLGVLLYPRDKKMHQRPLFQLAAIVVLLLGIVPFLMTSNQPFQKEQLAQNDSTLTKQKVEKSENVPSSAEIDADDATSVISKEQEFENQQMQPMAEQFDLADEIQSSPLDAGSGFNDLSLDATTSSLSRSAASSHPDGVFMEKKASKPDYSIALAEQADVLDLLTATF